MSWHTIAPDAHVIIQGMTGKEGMRMGAWMLEGGANVVAGVNPKKAGETAHEKPIVASVKDAIALDSAISVSCIVVPAPFVLDAAREALEAGIKLVHVLTEQVPVYDVMALRELAAKASATVLGPSSVGMLRFPRFRIGYLGGRHPFDVLREGDIALLSSSGGMTNEVLMTFAREGIGVRLAMHLGGDRVNGLNMEEALRACDTMDDVRAIAIFVEPGNVLLYDLASGRLTRSKPMTVLLPGDALEALPRGLPFGHAGTILGEDDPSLADLRAQIRERGIPCTQQMNEFIASCKSL